MVELSSLRVKRVGDVIVVSFTEPAPRYIQSDTSNGLLDELRQLVAASELKLLVVSLTGVDHCSNDTLSCLIATERELRARGGGLHLANIPVPVRRKFGFLNLDRSILPQFKSESDAISAFGT